jgi:hypothetical protein
VLAVSLGAGHQVEELRAARHKGRGGCRPLGCSCIRLRGCRLSFLDEVEHTGGTTTIERTTFRLHAGGQSLVTLQRGQPLALVEVGADIAFGQEDERQVVVRAAEFRSLRRSGPRGPASLVAWPPVISGLSGVAASASAAYGCSEDGPGIPQREIHGTVGVRTGPTCPGVPPP